MGLVLNLLCLLCIALLSDAEKHTPDDVSVLPEVHGSKFYYFGFGSNMLAARIHIQNPTAVVVAPAILHNYRLDFAFISKRWDGAVATIVPTMGSHAWGTLWQIELTNLADIDNQEGVHLGIYVPVSVNVELRNGTRLDARAYHLVKQPETNLHDIPHEDVPEERQPSKTYMQCLVKGAIESNIPRSYVRYLMGIKHNGRVAEDLETKLDLKTVALSY